MADSNIFKGCDGGIVREYLKVGKGIFEEPIILKIYQSTTAGDQTKGIAKTFIYNTEPSTGIVAAVEQSDVVYSGGIYMIGDIKVQLRRELKEIDDKTGCPGARIIWRNHEYRPVGRTVTHYLGEYVLYDYVFRRV